MSPEAEVDWEDAEDGGAEEEQGADGDADRHDRFGSVRRPPLEKGGSLTQTFKLVSAGAIDSLRWRASYRVRVKRRQNIGAFRRWAAALPARAPRSPAG